MTKEELDKAVLESGSSKKYLEDILMKKGIPKHEILLCISEFYNCPFVEYDEDITVSRNVLRLVDPVTLKAELWIPLSVFDRKAEVIAYRPEVRGLVEKIKETLGADEVEFQAGLPNDIVRIIENNFDLNPDFPPTAGRTPLAKVRTYLAERRSVLAEQRTSLARGRTGLAFLRTGIAFIAIAVTFFRLFGAGYLSIIELVLFLGGVAAVLDGFKWYLPVRKKAGRVLDYVSQQPRPGFTALEVSNPGADPIFTRSEVVESAENLRTGWGKLSPVERRRFLANDRTDLAEERTILASLRTRMAKARTGLAFARTGIAFSGLGIALLRQFHESKWTFFDIALILAGALMTLEGILWYFPGRRAGKAGLKAVLRAEEQMSIWESAFPPFYRSDPLCFPPVKACHAPGVWATTGLALERTVLAERRNIMARLRTVMARSRTGMAFIRTGLSLSATGAGLLIYFGASNLAWTAFDAVLVCAGIVLITDGVHWYLPAEKTKRQFPYCYGDVEIRIPDYSEPGRNWKKAVFSHDDI
ncbi:MAG TPA: DUF202 domain-containing protein [Thermodesulfovibrionales bacterium]|nr:DUF202 domain-containing protein [Thermodesulfovibrionales bacterium]